jgi:hypothetical protein
MVIGRPDVAGIYAALGMHEAARTARTARAMNGYGRWAAVAWPAPRRLLNGRPASSRRRERTGRDWRTQPRAEGGRWASHESTEGAA